MSRKNFRILLKSSHKALSAAALVKAELWFQINCVKRGEYTFVMVGPFDVRIVVKESLYVERKKILFVRSQ